MTKITKTATYRFEADLIVSGDTCVETVRLLVRNGHYVIHRAEFPAANIVGVEDQYTSNMLHSIVRMAGNQLRADGIR